MQTFKANIPQPAIDELQERIRHTSWPELPDEHDSTGGLAVRTIKELSAYWAEQFSWRDIEERINAYPNFITEIDGVQVHFLHIKSRAADAVPLIISHGWPGSFLELLPVVPLLISDTGVAFDLVIPSLPGFGFSGIPQRAGVNTRFIAGLWVALMRQLGYQQFMAQGGDFGALIGTHMALQYPEVLLGLHLNYIPFNYQPYLSPGEQLSETEKAAQQEIAAFFKSEGAYAQVQATKPLTLSYGLCDSPVGLCAWLLQLFHSFSDRSQPLTTLFDKDLLLGNVSLYWFTQTIYASMQLYRSSIKEDPLRFGKDDHIRVPVGIARYPFPAGFPARQYAERGYKVVYWQDMPKGGHFAAMEQPALFAEDLKRFAAAIL